MKKVAIAAATALAMVGLTGCLDDTDADVVSENLSKEADMFKIDRRIVFYNGITGDYILEVQGKCSLGNYDSAERLSVTCKVADGNEPDAYKKHFLGLSDNVTFFAEQLEPAGVSKYRYKVIFKPTTILPDIDLSVPGK